MNNIINEVGDFTNIGFEFFFVETKVGNFTWSKRDNVFIYYDGSYFKYMKEFNVMKVKFKGKHKIKDYCGDRLVVLKL